MRSSQQWIMLRAPPVNQTAHPARRQAGFYFKIKSWADMVYFWRQTGFSVDGPLWWSNFYTIPPSDFIVFLRFPYFSSLSWPLCCFRSEKVSAHSLIYTNLLNLLLALHVYLYAILLCYTFFSIRNVWMKMLHRFVSKLCKPSQHRDLVCAPYRVKQLIQTKI